MGGTAFASWDRLKDKRLTFDRSNRQPRRKVLLEQREDDEHRAGGQYAHRITHRFQWQTHCLYGGNLIRFPGRCEIHQKLCLIQDSLQQVLQGIEVLISNVYERCVPVVPFGDEHKESDGCKGRRGKRERNLNEDAHFACAVDLGRLKQRLRQTFEKRSDDQRVPCAAHQTGEDVDPIAIVEMVDIGVYDIGRDKATAE